MTLATDTITLRPATRADAPDLAWFMNTAGDGLPLAFWQDLAEPGQDPWDIGAARMAVDTGHNSWTNWTIAEHKGEAAGGLVTYVLDECQDLSPDLPPQFRPIIALENLAIGTSTVHVLATATRHRRLGVARRLLRHAAANTGGRPLSIIVDSHNTPAVRLYESFGFRETARRPITRPDGTARGGDWRLLVKR